MFDIKVENLNEIREMFKKAPRVANKELQKATKNAGALIKRTEVKEAPHKTGNLQRSIQLRYRPIVTEIYPTADYAMAVHEGTRPHTITPTRKKVLRFKGSNGQWVFTKKVNHPGTKANPFVKRTAKKVTPGINLIFKKALINIVNNIK